MKTTGVIRRIDDLGRVVIPKEVRKNLRIRNGENVEIFVDNDDIILRKHSPLENVENDMIKYVEALYQTIKRSIIITDRDKIIACSSNIMNKYKDKEISSFTERLIERRDSLIENRKVTVSFVKEIEEFCTYSCSSILSDGDSLGAVIIFSNDNPLIEVEEKQAVILAKVLGKSFSE